MKRPSARVLQHHIGGVFDRVVVVVEEPDDSGVTELFVQRYLVLCILSVDLIG